MASPNDDLQVSFFSIQATITFFIVLYLMVLFYRRRHIHPIKGRLPRLVLAFNGIQLIWYVLWHCTWPFTEQFFMCALLYDGAVQVDLGDRAAHIS